MHHASTAPSGVGTTGEADVGVTVRGATASCPDCGTALPEPTSWESAITRHHVATIAEQRCPGCGWQHVWRVRD